VNSSGLKTLHLTLWQEFSKKSFIIQLITIVLLVNVCRTMIFTRAPKIIFTILGAIILFPFFLQKPFYLIFAVVILTASIISSETLPIIPFAGMGSIHTTDLCLAMLFFYIIGRKLYYRKFYQSDYPIVRTPMDIPLLLFFASFVIALINGIVLQGGEFNEAFRSFRYVSYYLLFFAITNLVKDKKDLSLLIRGIFFIALTTALVSIAQQILGASFPLIFGRVEILKTKGFGEYADVVRAIPPGLLLIYFSLITLICIAVSPGDQGNKLLRIVQIVVLGLGIIFAFYRNMWFTFLFAILLFFSVAPLHQRARIIAFGLSGVVAVIILFLYSAVIPSSKIAKIVYASQDRILSVYKVKSVTGAGSDTLRGRARENEDALEKIVENPVMGIGLGTSYRPAIWLFSELKNKVRRKEEKLKVGEGVKEGETKTVTVTREERQLVPQSFFTGMNIHNSLLNIPLRFGILGSISFLWISVTFLARGFRNWKKIKDPFCRAVCIGYTVSYAGTLLTSTMDPFLTSWRGVIGIALMWGTNEAIYRLEGIEGQNT
jgi:hypothetical protein